MRPAVVRGSIRTDTDHCPQRLLEDCRLCPELLTALVAAHSIDAYGSEFDVSITTDGKIMVNHDPTIQGISIENNPYWVIMDKRLDNCETVPTLNQYLAMARYLAPTKLILEIKPHDQEANEDRCVDEVLRLVKAAGLESRTEYISFSYHVCKRLALKAPGAMVSYLGGDKTPAEVHADGIKGIDYDGKIIMKNPAGWRKPIDWA